MHAVHIPVSVECGRQASFVGVRDKKSLVDVSQKFDGL